MQYRFCSDKRCFSVYEYSEVKHGKVRQGKAWQVRCKCVMCVWLGHVYEYGVVVRWWPWSVSRSRVGRTQCFSYADDILTTKRVVEPYSPSSLPRLLRRIVPLFYPQQPDTDTDWDTDTHTAIQTDRQTNTLTTRHLILIASYPQPPCSQIIPCTLYCVILTDTSTPVICTIINNISVYL